MSSTSPSSEVRQRRTKAADRGQDIGVRSLRSTSHSGAEQPFAVDQPVSHRELFSPDLGLAGAIAGVALALDVAGIVHNAWILALLVLTYGGARMVQRSQTQRVLSKRLLAPGVVEDVRTGHDQLQVILNSMCEALLLFDTQGRLLSFNSAAEQMLEQPLGPYLRQSFLRWLRDTDAAHLKKHFGFTLPQLRCYVHEVLDHPTSVVQRQFEQGRGDNLRHMIERGSPVLDRQGRPAGWLLVWRDQTEEHKLDMLRQELSSMIVHDLRNPLTSISSSLSMLQDMLSETEIDFEAVAEVIQISQNSAENVLNLVQSLLDVARLEQNTLTLEYEERSLNETIDRAFASVLGLAMGTRVAMTTHIPADLPLVWIDAEKIRRVLINILDNALRHTPCDGQICVGAAFNAAENNVTVCVEDSGPGIPLEERTRIFDKFIQLDQRALRGHEGTGLGLTFCKLAVEAHGGRIWVQEGETGGASFCFTLPTVPPLEVQSDEPSAR